MTHVHEFILNKEQKEFVKADIEDAKLLGTPGSGKTSTLIYKIINLFELKQFNSTKNYLILTFSRKACKDFIDKGNNVDNKKFSSSNCKTFHSLCGTIIQTILKRSCSSMQTTVMSAVNVVKNEEELKQVKCLSDVKVIIVDEAQDMSDIQYELVTIIKDKLKCKLVLVGDPNQNIYQFQNGSDKYLMEYNAKPYYLVENNRSTPEIVNFINYFRPWKNNLPNMYAIRESLNKKPTIFSGTHKRILEKILRKIQNFKGNKENIAIIGPVKTSNETQEGKYLKFGIQAIANLLSDNKIQFVKHYNDKTTECNISPSENLIELDKINLYTIHGSKGLEFDLVIVVNFHTFTFGCRPTVEEYNQFKYLWYVALSRARNELIICVDNDKEAWYGLSDCPYELYQTKGKELIIKKPKFQEPRTSPTDIVEILNNKKYFTEKTLLELNDVVNFYETKYKIFDIKNNKDIEMHEYYFNKYSVLFTSYIKNIFEYWYCAIKLSNFRFVTYIENFVKNIVIVKKKFSNTLVNFMDKLGVAKMSTITKNIMKQNKNKFNKQEKRLYKYILKKVQTKMFSLAIQNDDVFLDSEIVLEICKNIRLGLDYKWNMFRLCLFEYQYINEGKYLWDKQEMFKIYIDILNTHTDNLRKISLKIQNDVEFVKSVSHSNIHLNGCIDILSKHGHIIDIKFVNAVDTTHKLEAFLKYNNIYPKWNNPKKFEIWNIKTGYIHIFEFKPTINNFNMLINLADITDKQLYNLVFAYDLETTGLNVQSCQIIERYVHELNTDTCVSEGVIKPSCLVPKLIHEITGITMKEICDGESIEIFKKEIDNIKKHSVKPIFIAHNGNVFDHQILKRIKILDQYCKTLDSRIIMRQLSKLNIGQYNLADIYKLIIGKKFDGKAHRAKADVEMMLDIFEKLNLIPDEFKKYVDI